MTKVTLTVNGETRSASVPPEMTLLRMLREEFNLTGSKLGCDVGTAVRARCSSMEKQSTRA